MNKEYNSFITVRDISKNLGVERKEVYKLIYQGFLSHIRVSKRLLRVNVVSYRDFLNKIKRLEEENTDLYDKAKKGEMSYRIALVKSGIVKTNMNIRRCLETFLKLKNDDKKTFLKLSKNIRI